MSSLHVICRVGESEYAIPAADVFQMEAYSGSTPVPGAPSFVIGLIQVRSQVIPVLDLRIRFGLEAVLPTLDSRIVVMKLSERLIGLLVDSAREVQNISPEQFKAPPGVISVQSAGYIKSVAQLKNRLVMLLDSNKIPFELSTKTGLLSSHESLVICSIPPEFRVKIKISDWPFPFLTALITMRFPS